MPAASYDLTIDAGATFKLSLTWANPDGTAVDMTGYRVRCQLQDGRTNAVVLDADTANAVSGVSISTPDTTGVVLITVAYSLTAVLDGTGRYVYDAVSAGGEATRLLQGTYVVSQGATA